MCARLARRCGLEHGSLDRDAHPFFGCLLSLRGGCGLEHGHLSLESFKPVAGVEVEDGWSGASRQEILVRQDLFNLFFLVAGVNLSWSMPAGIGDAPQGPRLLQLSAALACQASSGLPRRSTCVSYSEGPASRRRALEEPAAGRSLHCCSTRRRALFLGA